MSDNIKKIVESIESLKESSSSMTSEEFYNKLVAAIKRIPGFKVKDDIITGTAKRSGPMFGNQDRDPHVTADIDHDDEEINIYGNSKIYGTKVFTDKEIDNAIKAIKYSMQ